MSFISLFDLFIDLQIFCILRGPDFKIFPETRTFGVRESRLCRKFFPYPPAPKLLRQYLIKILLKTLNNTTLVHGTLDHTSQQSYPGIYVALVTLLTYPVSACTAERSFSGIKRLKNLPLKHYEWREAVLFGSTPHTQAQECGQSTFRIFPS